MGLAVTLQLLKLGQLANDRPLLPGCQLLPGLLTECLKPLWEDCRLLRECAMPVQQD